ncbi:MAG: isochorismatase family protein, partial [Christensenellaceae bacterium]|nr:isochorismatase family protein [Christensenellaceae bacterium]
AYLKGNLIEKEKMQRLVTLFERGEHKRHLPASPMNDWWKSRPEETTHVVVDMIHAFVDGTMACAGAQQAVENCVAFIDAHPEMRVLYVRDMHPADHCSFEAEGGPWPAHAVAGSEDAEWAEEFYGVKKTINTPIARYNVFNKGTDAHTEEYSGFNGQNEAYGALKFNLTRKVVVSGIATEYCVKNTALDLLKNGFDVSIVADALAYIDKDAHDRALAELKELGAKII